MSYESRQPCIACGTMGVQRCYHHVKSRGSGGPDEAWNMLSVCLEHHQEIHNIGANSFIDRYPSIEAWFILNGWYPCELTEKWKHSND